MSRNCAKHQDCEYIFLNLTEGKSESRLLCEICIQEQSETHSLSLITINTLKTKGLSQYQKFLQFADESSLLPLINFSLAKGDTLESINKFYDDLSTSFLQFVESKREQTQQAFHGLLEAQTKLQTLSRVEELQQILQQSEDVDSETLITKINSFFKSKNESKDEVKSYLESCLTKSSLLESFKQLSSKVDEIKEKVTLVLKMEDDINDLTELSQSEQRRVQLLKDRINSQTKQLQRLISQNQALRLQSNSLTGSSSQPQLSKEVLSLYQIDALNKSKAQNFLQKQIADAINNSKYFTPIEIIKSEDGLIFSRTQPGKPLLGIIDVPLSFENFGKSFKVKILQGYCAVGVCARDINVKRGYRFDNQIYSPQSGYNMVSTSGYTFSSFNSGLHNNYLKLHYYAVSTIEVTPCDNKVLYYHENFTKDFPFEPQEDIVYSPCFMLSENSSIEFLIDE